MLQSQTCTWVRMHARNCKSRCCAQRPYLVARLEMLTTEGVDPLYMLIASRSSGVMTDFAAAGGARDAIGDTASSIAAAAATAFEVTDSITERPPALVLGGGALCRAFIAAAAAAAAGWHASPPHCVFEHNTDPAASRQVQAGDRARVGIRNRSNGGMELYAGRRALWLPGSMCTPIAWRLV
eukprot:262621-Chlamydomonas_euryale.AAC.11